jgi:hypothetical protein
MTECFGTEAFRGSTMLQKEALRQGLSLHGTLAVRLATPLSRVKNKDRTDRLDRDSLPAIECQ